ncbi:hypothetical protein [Anditalea andensis]|uniref:hypothetical protein n=1 Tax=Anditalea andensis TaxID=1048983 RepID=UPI0013DF431C|nr:hypothetical protein [Anditalea andensis]
MKILLFTVLLLGFTLFDLFAQRGNNQLAIGAELDPVISVDSFLEYNFQVGLPIKIYYGTGNHGQWMFRTGLHYLWTYPKNLFDPVNSITANVVPFALGYRRNFQHLYAEGSVGLAWQNNRVDTGDPVVGFSDYPLDYGFEVGYQLHKIDIGISLQNLPYTFEHIGGNTVLVGLKAMYRFGL